MEHKYALLSGLIVAFALIPEESADPIGSDRLQHMFIQRSRNFTRQHTFPVFLRAGRHLLKKICQFFGAECPWEYGFLERIGKGVTSVVHRIAVLRFPVFIHIHFSNPVFVHLHPRFPRAFHAFHRHPGAGSCPAPITSDDPYRDIQYALELSFKIISDRAEIFQIFRICFPPDPHSAVIEFFVLSVITDLRHIKKTDSRIDAQLQGFRQVLFITHVKFHIGLSAGDPDFAHCDLRKCYCLRFPCRGNRMQYELFLL
jgi:hypothetical protein